MLTHCHSSIILNSVNPVYGVFALEHCGYVNDTRGAVRSAASNTVAYDLVFRLFFGPGLIYRFRATFSLSRQCGLAVGLAR